jgi:hypothetical protein
MVIVKMLHQLEDLMFKAFRGEAVVQLPRTLNNAEHESLHLA